MVIATVDKIKHKFVADEPALTDDKLSIVKMGQTTSLTVITQDKWHYKMRRKMKYVHTAERF